ncbi:deoxycytidine monophosphate deaminase [Martiniozyma asiatica (nom. inval.)]|nr:deoxycytidine monophosphate deaminase [Martiniozyma asiatica]
MFIGLLGTPGSGVEAVCHWLVSEHGFNKVNIEKSGKIEQNTTYYNTSQDLLDVITQRWREDFVIEDISKLDNLDLFLKRPFALVITVDSNLLIKYKRFAKSDNNSTTLEAFCQLSDEFMSQQFHNLQDQSHIKLINNILDAAKLSSQLESLNLMDPTRLRPSWDSYFMHFTDLAARRSNCMKRRVGCVIVKDNRIIATGYNGTAKGVRNCNEGGCNRCNMSTQNSCGVGLNTCLCLHAEENALLEAGRSRVEEGAILYCNTCPCLTCTIKIVQCGIKEVVYNLSYSMDELSANVFREAGVSIRQFVPPAEGTLVLN